MAQGQAKAKERDSHLLDAVLVDALEELRAVDEDGGDEVAQPLKHVPAAQKRT